MGGLDQIAGAHAQSLGQGVVHGNGRLAPVHAALVVGLQMFGVMARKQREHGLPFVLNLTAKDRRHGALAIEVDHQHLVAIKGRRHRQMRRR
ncbi:hypothetical protein THS5294_01274 [Thalassobacter stenotrophicus]|uniref:Uncharacterized protein n=1 Tax=Thalassobacter stenotrophicus TaxID=266809 RepID=A0A0P1EXY6_9RHOB|nr:hypothetical protein THS5294_01274 [Thalassobacter stenotrophicus]